jgi:antitoxin (DNA-binding transcriptional repressor) of toxin-antitoxin stability system
MQKTSMGYAKAHFSELCQLAAIKGQRILILRHGKPAAMIVPVDGAPQPPAPRITAMTVAEALGRDRLERTR